MVQVIQTLGLRTRGFFTELAKSEAGWAKYGRSAGKILAKEAVAGAAHTAGSFAMQKVLSKLFEKKPPASGPAGVVESMTGIDPSDPAGINNRFKNVMKAAGIASLAVGAAGARDALKFKDFSDTMDVNTGEAQRLDKAAERNGRSLDHFAMALTNIGAARETAARGNDELRQKFLGFGITLEALQDPAKRDIDLLRQLGAAMQDMNPRQRQELRDLLGKGGDKLGPALKAFEAMGDRGLIDDKAIKNIERGKNLIGAIWRDVKAIGANSLGKVLGEVFRESGKPNVKKVGAVGREMLQMSGEFLGLAESTEVLAMRRQLAEKERKKKAGKGDLFSDNDVIAAAEMGMEADSAMKDLKFSRLSPGAQEAELKRRIGVHLAEMRKLDGKDPVQGKMIEQHRLAAIGKVEQLGALQEIDLEKTDSLARIGGFAQGAGQVTPGPDVVAQVIQSIDAVTNAINNKDGSFP